MNLISTNVNDAIEWSGVGTGGYRSVDYDYDIGFRSLDVRAPNSGIAEDDNLHPFTGTIDVGGVTVPYWIPTKSLVSTAANQHLYRIGEEVPTVPQIWAGALENIAGYVGRMRELYNIGSEALPIVTGKR